MLTLTQGREPIHSCLERSAVIGGLRSREENESTLKGPDPLKDMTFPSS